VLMALVFAFELLPAVYMVVVSFMPRLSGDLWGKQAPGWTTGNYTHLFSTNGIAHSLLNSLLIAVVAATVCVALAVVTSWFYVRGKVRFHRLPDALAQLPMVVPGIVMGLATLIIYLRVPIPVYGTIWIIVLAFIPALVPFAIRFVQPALVQLSAQLTEQAEISGGSALFRARRVLLPLLAPALLGSWVLICVSALRELSAATLLSTQSSPVAATTMLSLWTNGSVNELAAFGTVIMLISVTIAALGFRLLRGVGVHV
jgi:iron(III) transport system permease protein